MTARSVPTSLVPTPTRGARVLARVLPGMLLAAVALLTLGPVLVVVLGSFGIGTIGSDRPGLMAWHHVWTDETTRTAMVNSAVLALRAPVGAVVALAVAWALIRFDIPGKGALEMAFWAAFFLPALPMTLSWILLLDPDFGLLNGAVRLLPIVGSAPFDIYSMLGITWVHITSATVPVMVILLSPAIRQLDGVYEEAARGCGASPLRVFRTITLPLLLPALLVASLAGLMKSLEAFEVERILGGPSRIDVYSTRIFDLVRFEPPRLSFAMAIGATVLLVLVVVAAAQQRVSRRHEVAVLSGRSVSRAVVPLGRVRFVIAALLWCGLGIAVILPLLVLLLGSFMKLFGFFSIDSPFTFAHWQTVLTDGVFLDAVRNSLLVSLGAGIGGAAVYSVLGYALARGNFRGRGVLEVLVWLPWTVPGILLGLGFLWLMLRGGFLADIRGTVVVLIAVMVLKEIPIGSQMYRTSIAQIGFELEESARVCGASPSRTFRTVVVPLVLATSGSVFLITFASALRDISTVILLAEPSTRTLSLLMLEFSTSGGIEAATVIGVMLAVAGCILAYATRRLGVSAVERQL